MRIVVSAIFLMLSFSAYSDGEPDSAPQDAESSQGTATALCKKEDLLVAMPNNLAPYSYTYTPPNEETPNDGTIKFKDCSQNNEDTSLQGLLVDIAKSLQTFYNDTTENYQVENLKFCTYQYDTPILAIDKSDKSYDCLMKADLFIAPYIFDKDNSLVQVKPDALETLQFLFSREIFSTTYRKFSLLPYSENDDNEETSNSLNPTENTNTAKEYIYTPIFGGDTSNTSKSVMLELQKSGGDDGKITSNELPNYNIQLIIEDTNRISKDIQDQCLKTLRPKFANHNANSNPKENRSINVESDFEILKKYCSNEKYGIQHSNSKPNSQKTIYKDQFFFLIRNVEHGLQLINILNRIFDNQQLLRNLQSSRFTIDGYIISEKNVNQKF